MLGLMPPVTEEDVKQAYFVKAKAMHPDRGGDPEQFILLQRAFEEANEYVRFKAGKLEWLASKIEAYAQQQEVVSETIERGGEVEMEEADWLRKSFGEDFGHVADRLVALRLRGPAADDVFAILLGFRAESLKTVDVHVEPTRSDVVSPGHSDIGFATASKQWPKHAYRRTHAPHEVVVSTVIKLRRDSDGY
jgi:curved DNA-binding protein CbpA